jgi:MFS family permease
MDVLPDTGRAQVCAASCRCGDCDRETLAIYDRPALSWLNFFIAAVQAGFGAFVPGYLAARSWGQAEIGAALSVDTLTAVFSQLPAGALVDAVRRRRALLAVAVVLIAAAALTVGMMPVGLPVVVALVLHSLASSVVGPAIAAISLGFSAPCGLGERMGRNTQFAALGGIFGAALMGAAGTLVSERAVFLLTAMLTLPVLYALRQTGEGNPLICCDAEGCLPEHQSPAARPVDLLRDRRVLVFAGCVFLFFLSNAAVVPIAVGTAAATGMPYSTIMTAILMIVPQLVVAAASARVGRLAQSLGRRPLLLVGFATLPLRALLFGVLQAPWMLVLVQPLDGIGAAVFGVLLPIVAADLTRGTGRYNLCLGFLGFIGTLGAAAGNSLAGIIVEAFGRMAAFGTLTILGAAAVMLVRFGLSETSRKIAQPAIGFVRS